MNEDSFEINSSNVRKRARELFDGRCIICLKSRWSHGDEHIIPESMGNNELILPRGVLCLICNSSISSDEGLFASTGLLASLRPFYVEHGKGGVKPLFKTGDTEIGRDHTGQFYIKTYEKNVEFFTEKNYLTFKFLRPIINIVAESRVLHKIAYECLWLAIGKNIFEHRFKSIRDYIGEEKIGQYKPFAYYSLSNANPGGYIILRKYGDNYLFLIKIHHIIYALTIPDSLPIEFHVDYPEFKRVMI